MRAPFQKGRFINWGCVGPLLACLAIVAGLIAGAVWLGHHSTPSPSLETERPLQ